MTDYAAVLSNNYPDAEWTLNGDDYDGLTWLSDSPKPSQADLDAAWPAGVDGDHAGDCARERVISASSSR